MDLDNGVFQDCGTTSGVPLNFQVETASSCGVTGPMGFLSRRMREMDPHLKMRRENGSFLELQWDPHCSSRVEMGMCGNFLSCLKGVKDPFEAEE